MTSSRFVICVGLSFLFGGAAVADDDSRCSAEDGECATHDVSSLYQSYNALTRPEVDAESAKPDLVLGLTGEHMKKNEVVEEARADFSDELAIALDAEVLANMKTLGEVSGTIAELLPRQQDPGETNFDTKESLLEGLKQMSVIMEKLPLKKILAVYRKHAPGGEVDELEQELDAIIEMYKDPKFQSILVDSVTELSKMADGPDMKRIFTDISTNAQHLVGKNGFVNNGEAMSKISANFGELCAYVVPKMLKVNNHIAWYMSSKFSDDDEEEYEGDDAENPHEEIELEDKDTQELREMADEVYNADQ